MASQPLSKPIIPHKHSHNCPQVHRARCTQRRGRNYRRRKCRNNSASRSRSLFFVPPTVKFKFMFRDTSFLCRKHNHHQLQRGLCCRAVLACESYAATGQREGEHHMRRPWRSRLRNGSSWAAVAASGWSCSGARATGTRRDRRFRVRVRRESHARQPGRERNWTANLIRGPAFLDVENEPGSRRNQAPPNTRNVCEKKLRGNGARTFQRARRMSPAENT